MKKFVFGVVRKRRTTIAITAALFVVAGMVAPATAGAGPFDALFPPSGSAGPGQQQAPPGEYRVNKTIVLDFGPGVKGGVESIDGRCVNANGEFPFSTTSGTPEVHNLWIDASTSFLKCSGETSLMTFRVYVSSPYQARDLKVGIGQDYLGGPYSIYCDSHIGDPDSYPLWCNNGSGTDFKNVVTVGSYRR